MLFLSTLVIPLTTSLSNRKSTETVTPALLNVREGVGLKFTCERETRHGLKEKKLSKLNAISKFKTASLF